ncbi:MAG: LacI family DNA-binding transcriptional regulator [Specibacter sp.]
MSTDQPAKVKDVAARAGVSVGTVSNVLNKPESVSPAKRTRVLAAISELGFVRNESARSLRSGSSHTVGLLVLDIRNPFFTDVAMGAEITADDHKHAIVLANSGESSTREAAYLDHFEEQRVQGILITPVSDVLERLDRMRSRGIPAVLVDRLADTDQFCSVSVDDTEGGRMAANHLIEAGYRRPAFVGGPMSLQQVSDRYRGASEAATAHGIPNLSRFETADLSFVQGRLAADAIAGMALQERPDAIFAANDILALGLLQSFGEHGIRVPEDIALIGFDDIDFASQSSIPLSSIRQPSRMIGQRAAELLFEEIASEPDHIHQQEVFTPELVIRRSTQR